MLSAPASFVLMLDITKIEIFGLDYLLLLLYIDDKQHHMHCARDVTIVLSGKRILRMNIHGFLSHYQSMSAIRTRAFMINQSINR